MIRLALPVGSLQSDTLTLLKAVGYETRFAPRTYRPFFQMMTMQTKLIRPQEIPLFVEKGHYELGITGLDWVHETRASVIVVRPLLYGRVQIVLAVPTQSDYASLDDLVFAGTAGGRKLRISTEYLNITASVLERNACYRKLFGAKLPLCITPWFRYGENPKVEVSLSFGASEGKPPDDADAVVDASQTGLTLRENNLKVIQKIESSESVLIANKDLPNKTEEWKEATDLADRMTEMSFLTSKPSIELAGT